MDKLQADKLAEIRKFHKDEEELLRILPLTKAAQVHEYITYLLQLVETQAKAIEEAVRIYETADMESDFADVLDGMYERLKEALTQV